MTEPIVIELGYIPPAEVRGNSRAHWAKKHHFTQDMQASGYQHSWGHDISSLHKGRLTFAFYHNRKIDLDNLVIGMKPFVDGLVKGGIFIDDDPDHVIYGSHEFHLCKKGQSKTVVVIEEIA